MSDTPILDITGETCPMTYVRTRLALDRLPPGALLEVWLRGADPVRQVPQSALRQGHAMVSCVEGADGVVRVIFRRK